MNRRKKAGHEFNKKDGQNKNNVNNKGGFRPYDEAVILREKGVLCLFRYHADTGGVEVLKLPIPREKMKDVRKAVEWCKETAKRKALSFYLSDMTVEEYVEDFSARKRGVESPFERVDVGLSEWARMEREKQAWRN